MRKNERLQVQGLISHRLQLQELTFTYDTYVLQLCYKYIILPDCLNEIT